MYLPRFNYPSKSDFGSSASPFLTEHGTSLLDHSGASGRRLAEYRGHCDHEPRQQYRPPWEWTLYQANRPIASPPPSCFTLPREAAQQGLPSPSEMMFNTNDCYLYGPSVPRFQRGFAGNPRALLGRYAAFNSDSHLLFPAGRNRVLPPVFDQFFDYTEEGVDLKADITPGSPRKKETNHADWRSCHDGESSEVRAETDSPRAAKEGEEDASGYGDSQAPGKRSFKSPL